MDKPKRFSFAKIVELINTGHRVYCEFIDDRGELYDVFFKLKENTLIVCEGWAGFELFDFDLVKKAAEYDLNHTYVTNTLNYNYYATEAKK